MTVREGMQAYAYMITCMTYAYAHADTHTRAYIRVHAYDTRICR